MPDIQMTPGDKNPRRYVGRSMLSAAVLAVIAAGSQAPEIMHAFTSEKEQVRLVAYQDGAGIWTICEGLIRYNGKPVTQGMHLTREQCDVADRDFEAKDLREAQELIDPAIWAMLSETTKASLGDIVHNLGKGKAAEMTAVRELNAGHLNEGCAAITLWIRDGGRDCRKAGSNCQGQPLRRMQQDELCLGVTPEQAQRLMYIREHRGPAS
jgi:lysozyme